MPDEPHPRPLPPARILPPPRLPAGYSARPRSHGPRQEQAPGSSGPSDPPYGPPAPPFGPAPRPGAAPYPGAQPHPPPGYPPPYDYRAQQASADYVAQTRSGHHQPSLWRQPPSSGYPGYGYGGYGWGPPPARRRRKPLAAVLLGTVGAIASLAFVLVLVAALVHRPGTEASDRSLDHRPARAENPQAEPVDPASPGAVVARNTLYQQGGLLNGNCPARDLGDAAKADQTRFYEALLDCLNRVWRPAIESAGYAYYEPGLVVFDSPVNTPCGNASPQDGRTLAFYCPNDNVLYADVVQMRRSFADLDVAYAIVIGHEFGHHVQQEVGILNAYRLLAYDNTSERLEINRRIELQASCLGGLFLGAIADSFPMNASRLSRLQQIAGFFGDEPGGPQGERDHGSGRSNREWISKGYASNDLETCNTFTARDAAVD